MSKVVKVGGVEIGGGNKIAIQSMTNVAVKNIDATAEQFKRLQLAGCDIVRVAVPDIDSAKALVTVKPFTTMPVVADIHYDYRLAIASMEHGADKIRINPGNMSVEHLKSVVDCARMHNVPIRIGVNGGSPNKEFLQKYGDKQAALVESLLHYTSVIEKMGFSDIVLSVKSSDVTETIAVNRIVAKRCDYPLHLGVTEAGPSYQGIIKNSVGIGSLLADGIGDTIRISLTDDPVEEVRAAKTLLNALNLGGGVTFVSCPKCGRCRIDLEKYAKEVYDYVKDIDCRLKIAVMGCEVNGIGECSDADLGMAGGNGKVAFFKKGKVFATVDECNALPLFFGEIDKLTNEKRN